MKTLVTVALGATLLSCTSHGNEAAPTASHANEATPTAPVAEATPTAPVAGAATEGIDMDAWNEVLGAIHGTYCGYYPTGVTIVARAIGIRSYNECHSLFAAMAPICVKNLKDANRWHVSSSLEGTKLGTDLGTCIDAGYQRAMKAPR